MKHNREFYICDRKRCEKCTPECKYTTSLFHSKYEEHNDFEVDAHGNMWERERKDENQT